MRKDILKYALLGLVACFCISAKHAEDYEEIAMARCSRDNDRGYYGQDRECYPEERRGRPDQNRYYPEAERRHEDRRAYYENDRARRYAAEQQDYRHDRRAYENRAAPKCSDRCGKGCCYPDARGNAGYTLDSAGRRRCTPGSAREYRISEQRNCDARGNCQEVSKLEEVNKPMPRREIVRKSAAQKVLEGY